MFKNKDPFIAIIVALIEDRKVVSKVEKQCKNYTEHKMFDKMRKKLKSFLILRVYFKTVELNQSDVENF